MVGGVLALQDLFNHFNPRRLGEPKSFPAYTKHHRQK